MTTMTRKKPEPRRTFLVECFAPRPADDVRAITDRIHAATAAATIHGPPVDYLGAVVVADDEVVFHLFTAGAIGAVRELLDRLPLAFERIVESVVIPVRATPRGYGAGFISGSD
jgi:hypothetical protein